MSLVLADVQPTENPKITEITVLEEFEGMTNGETLKALFPNIVFQKAQDEDSGEKCVIAWTGEKVLCEFPLDFWNSPYKGVSE